jgi:hypothetical protein
MDLSVNATGALACLQQDDLAARGDGVAAQPASDRIASESNIVFGVGFINLSRNKDVETRLANWLLKKMPESPKRTARPD